MSVTQSLGRCVLLAELKAHDLDDVLDLGILEDLLVRSFTNVQWFSLQWEHAKAVASDDAETGNGKCLGRVALSEYESALLSLGPSRHIGVVQLRDPEYCLLLCPALPLKLRDLLELGPGKDPVNQAALHYGFDVLCRELCGRSEVLGPQGHVLFSLGVEGRILDERVHKNPHVILHVMRLDLHTLVLPIGGLADLLGDLVDDVLDVLPTLVRADTVDERDLFELSVRERDADLPPVAARLEHARRLVVLDVQVDVGFEIIHGELFSIQVHAH